ncbi:biogenesis of lysosome-related organelles complex 1, subunit 3 [Lycorma delicatula]|uniref:biogenesis of lysosome-related organelles complex 1, subunit 3 n=1 Tax=Lycorma delicatula TaxID=130591 RepID=UPI003F518DE7
MDKQQCLVPGEASESDEENVVISVVRGRPQTGAVLGTVVPGEAPESDEDDSTSESKGEEKKVNDDDEDNDSYSSASEAFMYRAAAASSMSSSVLKYNTLLHRKLYDTNLLLYQGVSDLINKPLVNTSQKLSAVNLQLLSSQMEIQDAVSSMKRSFDTTLKLNNMLESVLGMPYLPKINVAVPTKNCTS